MEPERDPDIVAFERAVRHDALVNRMRTIYRIRALTGAYPALRIRASVHRERK